MKTLAILLFSVSLFAQNHYPDTLFLKDGRSFPCFVTDISESEISFIYSDNKKESLIIEAIKGLYVENYGKIYSSESGYSTTDQFDEWLISRAKRLEVSNQSALQNENKMENINTPEFGELNKRGNNKWSFGILYIPYYSGRIYYLNQSSPYPPYYAEIYTTAFNETNMEAQLSYAVMDELRFTFDVSYTATNYERRSESHTRSSNYNYDSGSLTIQDLALFDFNLGIKYYLKDILSGKVTIYALAAVGKQFASAEEKYESLFQDPPTGIITKDNQDEFTEDINSPFHFNLGFGAEYFFSESLSLTSNIRFIYSEVEGNYNSRTVSEYETQTTSLDIKRSDFMTRVGVGFNFYF